jgi:NADH dehydrogenase FAD-containing subunit
MSSNGNAPAPRPRVARGGVLIAGGGFAGAQIARGLGEATIVNPTLAELWTTCPGADLVPGTVVALDPERRVAAVRSEGGRLTIAYAELVLAVGSGSAEIGANPPAAQLGLPVDDRGLLCVDETLRVLGAPHVWALGDCAAASTGQDVISLAGRLT